MDYRYPLSPRLHSNYVPSDQEVQILRRIIRDREASSTALAQQINYTSAALAIMQAQQAADRAFIEENAMVLSPIRRVPADVLSRIFFTYLEVMDPPQQPFSTHKFGISHRHPSVVLSHVCSRWRSLALRTQQLWADMHIQMPSLAIFFNWDKLDEATVYGIWCRKVDAWHENVGRWLGRSLSCPIKLHLDTSCCGLHETAVPPQYLSNVSRDYEQMVHRLFDLADRLQNLTLIFDDINGITRCMVSLFDRPYSNFPLLERVSVYICDGYEAHTETLPCVTRLTSCSLLAAPSLREVNLEGPWGDIATANAGSTSSSALYGAITTLTMDTRVVGTREPPTAEHLLAILRSLPNLTSITVHLRKTPAISQMTIPMIHPNLRSMALKGRSVPNGLAAALTLPKLTFLHVDCHGIADRNGDADSQSGNAELVLKFGHQLKELLLHYDSFSEALFPRFLKQLANVVTLRLSGVGFLNTRSDDLDVALLQELSTAGICPNLAKLEIGRMCNRNPDGRTERAFVNLLVSGQAVAERSPGRISDLLAGAA
ncbi:hypothetical protein NMY22_g19771 [Coprinellus aureogranulatus]|nr:hypothetical protein NMY22_g19771 [Coprinellus aureogranulatus]